MGNFAENLNLGNRFRPPPPRFITDNFRHLAFDKIVLFLEKKTNNNKTKQTNKTNITKQKQTKKTKK